MDMETYSKSVYAMNDSLHDLQSDIQRLVSIYFDIFSVFMWQGTLTHLEILF